MSGQKYCVIMGGIFCITSCSNRQRKIYKYWKCRNIPMYFCHCQNNSSLLSHVFQTDAANENTLDMMDTTVQQTEPSPPRLGALANTAVLKRWNMLPLT